ncbi:MAG TPA: heterodisulfide reductase-related iron-sulfur binding cluster [Pyrinomonadaceae bacterium]|nr:heterodisulfide reductase-related iron-sulfur binding cluster [Pyrinomonadaceae bacterium]
MIPKSSTHLAGVLAAEEEKLLACVHCGLCLEACPTYIHTGDENDSPRGRIYLMRAVEEGRLSSSSKSFATHIGRCLGCRACEQACPAGVEYGQLLEASRAELSQLSARRSLKATLLHLALRHLWTHTARLRFAFACARLLRSSGLTRLLIRTRIARLVSPRLEFALALLDSSSPAALGQPDQYEDGQHRRASGSSQVRPAKRMRALLFKGCVTEGLFARVNRATIRVLEANGCAMRVPKSQACCGALHAHAGDLEGARALARRNIEAFAEAADAAIITNAGGCGAMLASYAQLLSDDPQYAERARDFSARVRDVSQQLDATGITRGASIGDRVTTYDASCHLIYGQRAQEAPLRMLDAIPDLAFVPLAGSEMCCGGAGVYNLLEMEMSARVLCEKLAHVRETGAEVLATGNPGCHMQIGAGAQLAGLSVRLCHPVELLDESYRRAGFYQ